MRAKAKEQHRHRPLRLRLASALSLALSACGLGTGAPVAHAGQTIVVENCDDSGSGSLREAYASAHDGDTVDLSALTCSTITLTNGPIVSAPDAGYVTLQAYYAHGLVVD